MKKNKRMNRSLLAGSVAIAIVAITAAVPAYRTLRDKAQTQAVVTEKLHRWQQSYRALSKATESWDRTYVPESSVRDLLSLLGLARLGNYNLSTDPDKLTLVRVAPLEHNGVHIGLTQVCIASASGSGTALTVSADRYRRLIEGVTELTKRKDIFIGSIVIEGDKPQPVAQLGDFCILLRGASA